jgi:hypothetical protein
VAQIAVFVIRVIALDCNDVAEGVRRTAMLQDGLGVEPSPVQLAKLQERTAMVTTPDKVLLTPYYGSAEPVGPRRLLDITAECAFFTGSLARRVWKAFAVIALLGLLGPVMAVLAVAMVGASQTVLEVTAKIVVASMAFWAVGDVALMAIQFFQLARDADRVLDRGEGALTGPGNNIDSEALTAFDEYNCAVAKSPPIPSHAYHRWGNTLNDAWKQRQGGKQPVVPPSVAAPPPSSATVN